jgi:hypothetical protein
MLKRVLRLVRGLVDDRVDLVGGLVLDRLVDLVGRLVGLVTIRASAKSFVSVS